MTDTSGKVVIVSGGATLIGQKITEAFHSHGAQVLVADINTEDGTDFAAGFDDRVLFKKTDITLDNEIDSCIQKAVDNFGGLDYLVNVACT